MEVSKTFWKNKKVLITGHTGFKGGWLSLWLQLLEAQCSGISLAPKTTPAFYTVANIGQNMESIELDITSAEKTKEAIIQQNPDIIFHLAAQSLVPESYTAPLETLATNYMGTAHILEAARYADNVKVIIVITTDKCYENQHWCWPYRETDTLGGSDPYSASKACVELLVNAYRRSFFNNSEAIALASVRAGNVFGGGDWTKGRLIPDIIQALMDEKPIELRHPDATRPWQFVLEPLAGYLRLAQAAWESPTRFSEAWNFGPSPDYLYSVNEIFEKLSKFLHVHVQKIIKNTDFVETQHLQIDSSKSKDRLYWTNRLNIDASLRLTTDWFQAFKKQQDLRAFSLNQINRYQELL